MRCDCLTETSISEIKEIPFFIIIKVWEKTNETRKAHHKHQMKVGKCLMTLIQPSHTHVYIMEKRYIYLFVTCGMIEKLWKKQRNRQFIGIKRNRSKMTTHPNILDSLQTFCRTIVKFQVQKMQRLEVHFLYFCLLWIRDMSDKRQATKLLGKHVNNQLRVAIIERTQYNSLCFNHHNTTKLQKKSYHIKISEKKFAQSNKKG